MDELNLPRYNFRISRTENHKPLIFDSYRKKFISLTPEEWVRQHILRYLTEEKKVPEVLVSVEAGIRYNKLAKRYDALIYDRKGKPWMLVECKAPSVIVTQSAFDQAVVYNSKVNAKYILVTNGKKHYCCQFYPGMKTFTFLYEIPDFEESEN